MYIHIHMCYILYVYYIFYIIDRLLMPYFSNGMVLFQPHRPSISKYICWLVV